MPIAAVPDYLGQRFEEASPGLRFGMYFAGWQAGSWSKAIGGSLDAVKPLTSNDQQTIAGLKQRQQTAFDQCPEHSGLRLDAIATAPFTTGLGNEHPLENGFAFLNPYGVPYLPGSGVKGVLRQAARELADGAWGDPQGWSNEPAFPLVDSHGKPIKDSRGQPVVLTSADVLFGRELEERDKVHLRGALSFWDVIPQIAGDQLMVEIMTPHYGHYYQQKADRKTGESVTPHDSGQPIPIHFLTVPPDSRFVFHVVCNTPFLARLAPELANSGPDEKPRWQGLIEAAFALSFDWLGFGAKTAVGYGALQRDIAAEQRRAAREAKDRAEQEREKALQAAVEGLPEDAAELKRLALEHGWEQDKGTLVSGLAEWLHNHTAPAVEAVQIARQLLEHGIPGLMDDPDATQGKKNKPKFKDTQRKLAHTIIELEAKSS